MRCFLTFFAALFVLALLPGCGAFREGDSETGQADWLRTPVDPSDKQLEESVRKFLENTGAPAVSRYDFRRFDLNTDGRRDALILLKTPYGTWCDIHGCTMLIFKAFDDHFRLVNAVRPIREPVYISKKRSHGWSNLLVRVSGRREKAKYVVLRFDGRQYPKNPEKLPPYPFKPDPARTDVIRIFYD